MISYPDIEIRIKDVTAKTSELAFMNKEQIFEVVAEIVAISDMLNNMIRDIDIKISEESIATTDAIRESGTKISASMIETIVKQNTAKLKADKEWADRQTKLLSELRMAALAAQRSAE